MVSDFQGNIPAREAFKPSWCQYLLRENRLEMAFWGPWSQTKKIDLKIFMIFGHPGGPRSGSHAMIGDLTNYYVGPGIWPTFRESWLGSPVPPAKKWQKRPQPPRGRRAINTLPTVDYLLVGKRCAKVENWESLPRRDTSGDVWHGLNKDMVRLTEARRGGDWKVMFGVCVEDSLEI